jgi:hypothetical protein
VALLEQPVGKMGADEATGPECENFHGMARSWLLRVEGAHESLKRSSNTVGLYIEIARNQA